MPRLRIVRRHPWWFATAAVGFAGLTAFVLVYFAPQDLFLQTSVNEPLPVATGAAGSAPAGTTSPSASRAPAGSGAPAPSVLAQGRFRSGEHDTSGRAALLRLSDGRRFVRLERFSTSNGPAVRVWLSAAPAGAGDDTVAGAPHVDLGGLKANHGNQNYRVPASADLGRYRSVVIWCRRFDVVFGSAGLTARR